MSPWLAGTRRWAVSVLVLAVLGLPWLASDAAAQQPIVFDDGDFKGQYAFSLYPDVESSQARYWTWVGSFYADGEGNITGGVRLMHWLSGTIWQEPVEQTFTGTYTVSQNGTGRATITVQTPSLPSLNGVAPALDWNEFYYRPEESFTFVLSDGGRHLQIVHAFTKALLQGVLTEPMVDHVRGEARRQDDACLRALGRLEKPFP